LAIWRGPSGGTGNRSNSRRVADAAGKEVGAITQRKTAVRKKAAAKRLDDLLKIVEKSLDADKAEDIVAIDLKGKSSIADFMVIATGRNSRQLAAMAQHLDEKLSKAGTKKIGIEGLAQGEWVLLDGGDIIVHLFRPEIRKFYNLEKMWGVELPEPERLMAVG
jgi:ribosome-associated protein